MPINPLNPHYSIENPATIFDEEAMTALQLAGRTAAKVNECVEQVNKNTEALPGMVSDTVLEHINKGAFDAQIDEYAGELEEHIEQVDAKHDTNLSNATNTLNKRIDNIVSHPGDGSTPTEVVDARQDFTGHTHETLKGSVEEQVRLAHNHHGTLFYLGSDIELVNGDDGAVIIKSPGRFSYYGRYGTSGTVAWEASTDNIKDYFKAVSTSNGVIYAAEITIPKYKVLVYDRVTAQYFIRTTTSTMPGDVVLCANAWNNPYHGLLVDEWKYKHILKAEKNIYTVRGAYLYGGDNFKMEFTRDEETQSLYVTMYGRPTVCYGSEFYTAAFIGDAIADIADKVTYPDNTEYRATFKVPGWNAVVWNHLEKRWKFRYRANLQQGDILALATGYCQPLCGTLLEEWSAKKNQEFEKYLGSESMSFDPPAGVLEYAGLISTANKAEKFLWFTDPHLCEGVEWQTEFETYRNSLKACYNATPTTFAVCGGDWLGNADTQAEACFKLGYLNKQMMDAFGGNYYPVVGNHDTNYQGVITEGSGAATGRLSHNAIRNVWNRPGYYTFNGEHTKFFVFDSELDWDLTMNQYKAEQVTWLCNELRDHPAENMAFILHIYFSEGSAGELGAKLSEIAKAYNNRQSVTFDGATFNYSGATGKIRFILAGHSHEDHVNMENDIPVIRTANTRNGGTPTMDLCMVNYDTNTLHLCRVGSGESRVVNI